MNKSLQDHIDALKDYAEHAVIGKADVDALDQKTKLMEEIQSAVRRFERKGLPVPEGLAADRVRIEADISQLRGRSEIEQAYEALLPIVVRLGRTCQRPLPRDLREVLNAYDGNTTSPRVFRDLIVLFLKESAGSARLPDVMNRIEQSLQGHFTASDLGQTPRKRWCRWVDNVRLEIRKMKDEHILARRGTSTLMLVTHDRKLGD